MILALLLVVAAFVMYFDLLSPAYAALQTEKGQELSNQQLLSNEKQIVTQVQSLISQYQNQTQSQQSASMALPTGPDVAGALNQLYGLASANTINIQSVGVSLQAVAATPTEAPVTDQIESAAEGASITEPLGTISFSLTATGSYENFQAFLQSLETNIRLFDVQAISLASNGASNQDNFTYSLTVVTYYQGS